MIDTLRFQKVIQTFNSASKLGFTRRLHPVGRVVFLLLPLTNSPTNKGRGEATVMMLSLGDFQFSVDTAAYTQLTLRGEYPWTTVERPRNTPQYQATGKETRSITLEGVVYPTYRDAGVSRVAHLRDAAAKMEPQYLVDGNGRYLGRWIVKSISQTDTVFFEDGTPRKQEFTLEMEQFDL